MRFVIQRVTESSVKVDGEVIRQDRERIHGPDRSCGFGYKRHSR